jgi:hypothetical protein
MPYNYIWKNEQFYCWFFGIVTWEDLFAASGILYGSKKLDDSCEVIIEFSETTKMLATPGNAEELAYLDKAASIYNNKINLALIVSKPEARKFVLTYVKASRKLKTTWNYKIFESLHAAEIWLNKSKVNKKPMTLTKKSSDKYPS